MRVLWFEVTPPQHYQAHGFHGAGWQDALEHCVRNHTNLELGIAFESKDPSSAVAVIDDVHYYPLRPSYTFWEKLRQKVDLSVSRDKLITLALQTIESFKPDVIHVFGSEWCYGQVAEYVDIPVVIHIQGAAIPYNNAYYPPGYNIFTEGWSLFLHWQWKSLLFLPLQKIKRTIWVQQEQRTFKAVKHYMGRTTWDKNLVRLFHPGASYHYCSEALRPSFMNTPLSWVPGKRSTIRLTTTGCSTLWKGLDTILRTAKLLTEQGFDFEWCMVGATNNQKLIEWKEKTTFSDVNIRLLGMLNADALIEQLLTTDIYVHTAYIDNSPNSICEAQYLGVPIIATYVGGIPSLIENGQEGLLVPANDPYTLAAEIKALAIDIDRQHRYSTQSRVRAIQRHHPERIVEDLMTVYNDLISNQ